ncbi:MAG: ATP synthase F1 subunit epsilon [Patescibacteria group bacterium]
MKFRLITPERIAFEADIQSITLPTMTGEITVLPGHIPLVSQLGHGELIIRDKQEHAFAVAGGFVSVMGETVDVLAESADHADEIDLQKAEEAKARSEKLREAAQGEEELATASAALERALAQIKVAGRKRKHHLRG